MDLEFVCIYNPDYGTEENVDPQLVYTSPKPHDYIKLIGIAQGIAELSYSFGKMPAKWFKTGKKHQARMVLVVPLHCENPEDWRSGFWFTGQLPTSSNVPPPEIAFRLVELAFEQHILQYGKPNENTKPSYWEKFVSTDFLSSMPALVAPHSICVAPGLLNPITKREIEKIRDEQNAHEILVTTVSDGAAVYPGEKLGRKTRITLQRWLEIKTPKNEMHRGDEKIPQETEHTNSEVESEQPIDEEQHEHEYPSSIEPQQKPNKDKYKSSWLPSFYFNNISFSSMSSSVLSMPSMPSIPSIPISDWWSNKPNIDPVTDGSVMTAVELFDLDTNEKIYVSVWRKTLYNFVVIHKTRDSAVNCNQSTFESLTRQLEGFSFAFEPPAKFYYMIIDPNKLTVISTFPSNTNGNQEVTRSILDYPNLNQEVVRLGSTWLYFIRLDNGVYAIFGKKNVNNQHQTLLGALHSDVQQWLDEYKRKYL